MKVTEIRVGLAYTHNLGNYESARFEASETRSVEEGDDPGEVWALAQESVRSQVLQQYNQMIANLQGDPGVLVNLDSRRPQ